ncbi:MAG TPA: PLP-dependent aminotransferase family protein [Candidatus Nitrosocosmicus sp.]|nr:PLP-dependent aminotransferase family protein [Candidatus Nitrosocosmicus sp.]
MKYSMIVDDIMREISSGSRAPGSKMPSIRDLCARYKCTKSTALRAYYELKELNLVYSMPGSGYYLISNFGETAVQSTAVDFSGTSLDKSSLPYNEFQPCISQAISKYKEDLFAYTDPKGLGQLTGALRKHLQDHQVFTSSERIFVTTGSQQALNLLSRMHFPNAKTNVVLEQPTYQGMIECLKQNNISAVGVSRDFSGLDLEGLERAFRNDNIKFFYTIPRFNNPLGLSYSNADKKKILSLAEKYNVYIVEDDYLGDLEEDSKSTPIFSFDKSDRVVYIKTFSKVVLPSMRIAVTVLPKLLINEFRDYKYWADINTPLISQGALEIYLNSGMFNQHINKIRRMYSLRMSQLKKLSEKHTSPSIQWHIPGKGGFYAGLEILNSVRHKDVVDGLLKKNILLTNLENYYLKEFKNENILRLSITRTENSTMESGIVEIINEIENGSGKHKGSIYL